MLFGKNVGDTLWCALQKGSYNTAAISYGLTFSFLELQDEEGQDKDGGDEKKIM